MTEDEMVGWHHRLSGRGFEQTQAGSEGQGSLACCSYLLGSQSQTRLHNSNSLTHGVRRIKLVTSL